VVSYSSLILIECLILIPFFTFLLFSNKKPLSLPISGKRLALLMFIGALALFLLPKLNLLYHYDFTKLTSDAWEHYRAITSSTEQGHFDINIYPFYSLFPVTYASEIFLAKLGGISLFNAMTAYYLVIGVSGLLIIRELGNSLIKGSKADKIVFTGVISVVYGYLQYFNLVVVQQYPLALGAIAALLSIYSFTLLPYRKNRSLIFLGVAAVLLCLSHPFAGLLTSILFAIYVIIDRLNTKRSYFHRIFVTRHIAVFLSLTAFITGVAYTQFATPQIFEHGIEWSARNFVYSWDALTSEFFETTEAGVEESFESRYQGIDAIIYPLNWSIPASTSLSVLIYALYNRLHIDDDERHLIVTLSVVSVLLFIPTFALSFVEFAFSRYFGTYALMFNAPVTAYVLYRIIKARIIYLKYAGMFVFAAAIIASITDPTFLPEISFQGSTYRDEQVYPKQPIFVAWNDFYSKIGDQNTTVLTNLHPSPITPIKKMHNYTGIIFQNSSQHISFADASFIIIDKDILDFSERLQANTSLNKVYDNSVVFFGR
jgi:hypothetical protein